MSNTLRFAAADVAPGTCRAFTVGGRSVMVYNLAGTFYATQGLCTHEDLPLDGGTFAENVVICPWHGSRFNVRTGKVLTPPAESNLRTYHVQVEGETIVITLS